MILLLVYPVGFVDVAIGFDRVPLSIDNKFSPPNMVNIISFIFFMSPPFSTSLCNLRRSHDIDVVDRYSDFAISHTTTAVGGLEWFIWIDDIVEDVGVHGTVRGVPILGNAIGEVASPNDSAICRNSTAKSGILSQWCWNAWIIHYSLCLLMPARQSLLSRSCSRAAQALSASPQQRLAVCWCCQWRGRSSW